MNRAESGPFAADVVYPSSFKRANSSVTDNSALPPLSPSPLATNVHGAAAKRPRLALELPTAEAIPEVQLPADNLSKALKGVLKIYTTVAK